ncbi:ion transporter [Microlunatus speluncae]|uniref:ion transporter n=1 Tax=Microlunatus speluncae TaxID=2594267 RepID=UPI001375CFD7|nr:ion transporter [Microlunatus speluncae]
MSSTPRTPYRPPADAPRWQRAADQLVNAGWFQNLIVAVILANAVTIGIHTYRDLPAGVYHAIELIDYGFLGIFVIELVLRFVAHGCNPIRFFRDPWNVFDTLVVAAAFVPGLSNNTTALRLIRLLRVVRLLRLMPDVHVLMDGLRRAAGPAASLLALTGLLCFVYAILGNLIFGEVAPQYFGNLGEGVLTLFTLLTLEGWNSVLADLRAVSPWGVPFTISFVLVGTYVVINLVVGVVINSLDEAYRNRVDERAETKQLTETIHDLRKALDELETKLKQTDLVAETTVGPDEVRHLLTDHPLHPEPARPDHADRAREEPRQRDG